MAKRYVVLCQPKIDGILHPEWKPSTIPKKMNGTETGETNPGCGDRNKWTSSEAHRCCTNSLHWMISRHCRMRCMRWKWANKFIVAVTGVKQYRLVQQYLWEQGQGSVLLLQTVDRAVNSWLREKWCHGSIFCLCDLCPWHISRSFHQKYDGNTELLYSVFRLDEIDNDTIDLISVAVLGNSCAILRTLALAVGSPWNEFHFDGNITSSAYSFPQLMRIMIFHNGYRGKQKWKWALIGIKHEVWWSIIVTRGTTVRKEL